MKTGLRAVIVIGLCEAVVGVFLLFELFHFSEGKTTFDEQAFGKILWRGKGTVRGQLEYTMYSGNPDEDFFPAHVIIIETQRGTIQAIVPEFWYSVERDGETVDVVELDTGHRRGRVRSTIWAMQTWVE